MTAVDDEALHGSDVEEHYLAREAQAEQVAAAAARERMAIADVFHDLRQRERDFETICAAVAWAGEPAPADETWQARELRAAIVAAGHSEVA